MRKQLVPLSKFRNTDILDDRLVMHDFGWPIIPIRSGTKKGILDWPRIKNDRDAIQGWHKSRGGAHLYLSTSLRMEGDWFVIDVDVTNQAAVDALLDRWHAQWPGWFGYCLERNAGGVKLALIGRISEPGQKTPKTIVYEGGHKVEFHLGGTVRHLVLFGQHPDGGQYQFVGDSPLTVKHDDLPEFDFDQLDLLREITAEILDARFTRVSDLQAESSAKMVFDLTPDTVFITFDKKTMTCAELEKELGPGDELRGILGGENAWGASKSKEHCNAKLNMFTGVLQIHDFMDDVTHHYERPTLEMPAELREKLQAAIDENAEALDPTPTPAEETGQEANGGRLYYTDLVAHSPTAQFIHRATGALWPSMTVDKRLAKVAIQTTNAEGEPEEIKMPASTYIMKTNAVEQLSWVPGGDEVVEDAVMLEGGLVYAKGKRIYNLYKPPLEVEGDPAQAGPWIDHMRLLYPDYAEHLFGYFAHMLQFPADKINHGLLMGGAPGIGKDTLISVLIHALGRWNCQDITPRVLAGEFNKWQRCLLLRISEMYDLGAETMYSLYERMKPLTAAPPEVLRVNEKRLGEYYIMNVLKVVATTNYLENGVYLPPDDRRTHVSWSALIPDDEHKVRCKALFDWIEAGGWVHAAAWLRARDLSGFDAKGPPPKTDAFWSIVNASRSAGDTGLDEVMEAVAEKEGGPRKVLTTRDLHAMAAQVMRHDVSSWVVDAKYRKHVPAALEKLGYISLPNPNAVDRKWLVDGVKQIVYRHRAITTSEAISELARRGEAWLGAKKGKDQQNQ